MLLVWVLFPSLLLTCMNTVFVCGIDWHLAMHLLAISEKIVPFWTMSAMNCTPSPNTHKHHFSFCSVSLFTSRLNVPVVVSTICRGLSDHVHLRLHASGVSCTVVVSINAEQSLDTRRTDVQFAHKGFFGFTLQGSHTDMKVIKKKADSRLHATYTTVWRHSTEMTTPESLGLYVILPFYSDTNNFFCYSHWINHLRDTAPHQSLLKFKNTQNMHAQWDHCDIQDIQQNKMSYWKLMVGQMDVHWK